MKTMKERRAEARARLGKAEARFREEAIKRGVPDVDAYVVARIAESYGLDGMYDPPRPPSALIARLV